MKDATAVVRTSRSGSDEGGQILPIVALFMFALLLFAALAIDVTSVLSAERFYTTTADASALAGAQDLQNSTQSRLVTADDRTRARQHALDVLVQQLGDPSDPPTCPTSSDIVDCLISPFKVSIQTPSPTCIDCDANRAVQVTIRNPEFRLTFARLVGQGHWNVESSAVAGLTYPGAYAIQALKPLDSNFQDGVLADGTGTVLTVHRGDIGTNTNADLNGQGAEFRLSEGYAIHYYDDSVGEQWGSAPPGLQLPDPLLDPNYATPTWDETIDPIFSDMEDGEVPCDPSDPAFPADYLAAHEPVFPTDYASLLDPAQNGGIVPTCYQPGIYRDKDDFRIGNGEIAYLFPGTYRFDTGVDVNNNGSLYGGLVDAAEGVLLEIPQAESFDGEASENVLLNVGGESCRTDDVVNLPSYDDCRATPAVDFRGSEIATPDRVHPVTGDTIEGLAITFHVPRDPDCFTGTLPVDCGNDENHNDALKLAGGARMAVAGVIYAPSDNVAVSGGTEQGGYVGQIIAWTVKYSGGSTLLQDYPHLEQIGILRLDSACTGTAPCNN